LIPLTCQTERPMRPDDEGGYPRGIRIDRISVRCVAGLIFVFAILFIFGVGISAVRGLFNPRIRISPLLAQATHAQAGVGRPAEERRPISRYVSSAVSAGCDGEGASRQRHRQQGGPSLLARDQGTTTGCGRERSASALVSSEVTTAGAPGRRTPTFQGAAYQAARAVLDVLPVLGHQQAGVSCAKHSRVIRGLGRLS
jgi:hypothetical protein